MKKVLTVLLVAFAGLFLASCGNNKEELVVGLEAGYAPFNWAAANKGTHGHKLDGRVDYVDGYDVEIARRIADGLGKKLVIKAIEWDGLIAALESGEIDLIIAGMTETPSRATSVLFSEPYFEEEAVILVRKDNAYASGTTLNDFDGARVVAQMGTIYVDFVGELAGAIPQTHLATYAMLELALTNKTADIVIAEKPVALGMVEQNEDLTYIVFAEGEGFDPVTVSIGMKLGRGELKDQIDAILANITEEQRKEIMDAAVARQGQ